MTVATRTPNPDQRAAIEEAGVVFVSAGAGTGKTTVLVERFVKAVCERALPIDSVLVITYTERAAGELRTRIRERLVSGGRHDLAREIDGAWISTIHGFCSRLLRLHPFEAGIDPRFRVLDDSQARVLKAEAFEAALAAFCAERAPERLALLATYGSRRLAAMLGGVFERLRSAGRPLELGRSDGGGLGAALARLRESAARAQSEPDDVDLRARVVQALELAGSDAGGDAHDPVRFLDLSDLRAGSRAGDEVAAYDDALAAVESAALEAVAARDRDLLQALLVGFEDAYRSAKARESALDFEDLQLLARDLLAVNETVRERTRWRFRSIMIDEFQDTNRLQCDLIDLLSASPGDAPAGGGTSAPDVAPDVFYVGDEFQSIYRFRHADVDVFRERRSSSSEVLALRQNYRSRPEVLAFVNHIFGTEFGTEFEPLVAAGRFPEPVFGAAVELLVTDKSTYRDGELHWREAEARHAARRVRELVDAGECAPGEVVVLLAAGTDAERYEQALREEGLPTYRAAGRGYFGQQQVADLVAYLRLLHNRYDDEALVSVLASPFVGVSNDALVLLRRAAGRRPLFSGLERELPRALGPHDRRLFEAFRQRYERLVGAAARVGLERLCERILVEHDYDLAVLARWDGRRRYANLRKLARLARSYEDLRGPDIEGFVRFLRDQEAAGAKELEAVAEEEGSDAVRLLTVHAAKGLEFKVVVLADAGRTPPAPSADEILCLPDGRFAFRVVNPVTGERAGAFGYDEVRREEHAAEQAENRRLLYVAMTRAIDRLILSGAVDPTSKRDASAPLRWVLSRLDVDVASIGDEKPVEVERDAARVLVRVGRRVEDRDAENAPALDQLELFAGANGGAIRDAPRLPPLPPVPEPPASPIRILSYSALALFERCSYRFYAERIAGLAPADARGDVASADRLAATELGDAVHDLLERDVADPDVRAEVLLRYPDASEDDVARAEGLVRSWRESPLAERLAAHPSAWPELSFAFEQDDVLLHGRFDVFALSDGRALVVDYKTNRLEEASPADVVADEYHLQRLVYALAALRAGAEEVEVAYVFLERPDDVVSARFKAADASDLAAELSKAIARIQSGEFRPTPGEFVCSGCPVLDVVCAGPRLPRAAASVAARAPA
jgi:ATP-dependent helicase/nuclease subunit A